MSAARHNWLISRRFDLGWFAAPGALALLVALVVGLSLEPAQDDSVALWIISVVLVDVTHVWASLYRTYLDPEARRHHARLLRAAPVLALLLGFMAHAASPAWFWTGLAYVAVFHFIKQQVGFVALYLRAGGEVGEAAARDRTLAKAAIWASTLGPVIWWHAQLPRRFEWFIADDFVAGLPEIVGTVAVWAQVPILLAFALRRVQLAWRAQPGRGHPMVPMLVALTALSWNLGIVWFNDGRVFTISNVFIHGVPYIALIWVTGGREQVQRRLPRLRQRLVPMLAVFYGLLVLLAVIEETLWDRLVWHDHPMLFGHGSEALGELGVALAVALLTVPQLTHYVLDRFIWRVGPKNPHLAEQLGMATPRCRTPADVCCNTGPGDD